MRIAIPTLALAGLTVSLAMGAVDARPLDAAPVQLCSKGLLVLELLPGFCVKIGGAPVTYADLTEDQRAILQWRSAPDPQMSGYRKTPGQAASFAKPKRDRRASASLLDPAPGGGVNKLWMEAIGPDAQILSSDKACHHEWQQLAVSRRDCREIGGFFGPRLAPLKHPPAPRAATVEPVERKPLQ